MNLPINTSIFPLSYNSVNLIRASDIHPKPIDWLWKGWLASGKFHILGGIAGTGKTTISLALASIISKGGIYPDGSEAPQGNVVIWTGEDDIKDTITPRLIAMKANLDQIHFVGDQEDFDIFEGNNGAFNPSKDMDKLKIAIAKIGNVKLLIIDPVVSVLDKKTNSHANAEVRKDLIPLVKMAEEMNIAILGITHFTKGTQGQDPIERITGSLAFGAVARIVLVASKNTNNVGEEIRIFARAKSNIGLDDNGFEYSLDQTLIGEDIETSKITWGKLLQGSAKELLFQSNEDSDRSSIEECMEYLTEVLSDGKVLSSEIKSDCKEKGFSESTLKRAKKKLGVISDKDGYGKDSVWYFKLLKSVKDDQRGSP
jgi:putative DNA primase/helicase